MTILKLHGHPFSSYTWKALIALYEKDLPFELLNVEDDHSANPEKPARLRQLWPPGQFPVLEDGDRVAIESSILIEHLDLAYPNTMRLIPADPQAALEVRFMDRVFDNHVMANMQAVVGEHLPFITEKPRPHAHRPREKCACDDLPLARRKAARRRLGVRSRFHAG